MIEYKKKKHIKFKKLKVQLNVHVCKWSMGAWRTHNSTGEPSLGKKLVTSVEYG